MPIFEFETSAQIYEMFVWGSHFRKLGSIASLAAETAGGEIPY